MVPFFLRGKSVIIRNVKIPNVLVWTFVYLLAVVLIDWAIIAANNSYRNLDTEILNGSVTGAIQKRVSCEHSYQCNPYTICSSTGKSVSCQTYYHTCYEHDHDYDWIVESTLGDFKIDRIDGQGVKTPPRWKEVVIGEPVAKSHSYMNYIRGNGQSLFKTDKIQSSYPVLPNQEPYDYYRYKHVIVDSLNWNPNELESLISDFNAKIGAQKQVNIRVIVTSRPEDFAEITNRRWLGGKKNELNVFIGSDGKNIKWVRVFSWSYNDLVNVTIQSDLAGQSLDASIISDSIQKNVMKYYNRKQMKDFQYLNDEVSSIPVWLMVVIFMIDVLPAAVILYMRHRIKKDLANRKRIYGW
jgi:hypothetical protein